MSVSEGEKDMTASQDNINKGKLTKKQTLLTICLYTAFATLGLANSLTGPSLVHLGYLYNKEIAEISFTYSCNAMGYLTGSILCALLFDRCNQELQFFLACLDMGIFTMVAPWFLHLYGYFVSMGLANVGKGFIDAAGQSYIITLWYNHRFKNPAMQGIHAIWSVGAFLCPLIIGPFLIDLPQDIPTTTPTSQNISEKVTTMNLLYNHSVSTSTISNELEGLTNMRYPYAIVGGIGSFLSFSFLIAFCLTRKEKHVVHEEEQKCEKKKLPGDTLSFQIPIMIMQVFFYFFYAWYETVPGGMLSVFVIKGLQWQTQSGPRITSLYWASNGIGRVVGIPVSALLSPGAMIWANIFVTSAGFMCMYVATSTNDILMWFSAIISGFGMATTFPSAILWTANHMTITGAIGATFLIASSIGILTGPFLAGYLFDNYSHMWVIHISIFSSLVHVVLFTIMNVFVKIYETKRKKRASYKVESEANNGDHAEMRPLKYMKGIEVYNSAQHLST